MTIGRILNEKLLVGIVNEIKCSICKNIYFPDDSDISLSPFGTRSSLMNLNGNQYFKNCKGCRAHRLELKKKYDEKKRAKSA